MAILPICIYGQPVLHTSAEVVTEFDKELHRLIADMHETTVAAPGVGLAAPQIGIGKRIFVWNYADQDEAPAIGVAINPELWITPPEPGQADPEHEAEGCLSFPGERFELRRSAAAKLRAQDADGKWFEISATGWFARIMQHEYDHLNGYIYVDRLTGYAHNEAMRIKRKRNWGKPGLSWTPGIDSLEG
ncbi:peptide deformylase [Canibacter sp. lx-72]|uniref:peptide deformylase n=1 Tax=Canibacter zhuwentaonis TaxID=2837491 RepID=UPI001BDC5B02|nr:peptide deformylase [Canibacter zhuwentaonis]MBT1017696.1 peptide deformylase [Canibacter zhuwentaonis]